MTITSTPDEELPPQPVHLFREVVPPSQLEPFYQGYDFGVPIAFDIGGANTRVGLTNSPTPNNVFPTVVSRYRDRKAQKSLTLVGNDVYRDQTTKYNAKSPYDGPLVTNWEYIECILDYSLEHLGAYGSNWLLENPVIMTESVATPVLQRRALYELLFETYSVPGATFGIDHLFANYANNGGQPKDGLVIGTGHESTHVIPVLQGKGLLSLTKRIDWGASQSALFLQRLITLKYPYFPSRISPTHFMHMFQDHCYVSQNYFEEVSHFLDIDRLEHNDIVVQAPVEISATAEKKKSEEELARQAARRKEQGKRLQEQARQKRIEKLAQKQQEFEYYTNLEAGFAGKTPAQIELMVVAEQFEDYADFKKYLGNLEKSLKRANNEEEEEEDPAAAWPLVDIPDDQLTEDQVKEKRKQKLLKANHDARERAKEAKREDEELQAKLEREQQEWRERDLEGWCDTKRLELAELISQIKEREKLIASFKDRKSMAAQQRMKSIADLANDETKSTTAQLRKRRRNVNVSIDNDPNDTFGANDDDWNAYRDISNAALEEEQSKDYAAVVAIEEQLLLHDPNFHQEDTLAASQKFDWRNSVLHKFIHGPRPNVTISMQAEGHDPDEIANHPEIIRKNHQIHLNVERIRVPEVLFQPSIAGLDQAGITEISDNVFHKQLDGLFAPGGQSYNVVQNILLTGGMSLLPNYQARVVLELTSILPVGTPLSVRRAANPITDPWRGMQLWAQTPQFRNSLVTRQEYLEFGPEYIKEHDLGNVSLL